MLKIIQQILGDFSDLKRIVVGVSGGSDSVALAHAIHQLNYEVIVAHLNHCFRGAESDADERFVQDFAKSLGVLCITQKSAIPKTGNLENNARIVRYGFLERVFESFKADAIAIAHHQDDQIETILMHKARGAGLRGMIGMKKTSGNLIRPLLNVPKSDVLKYLRANKLNWREDSTNKDKRFERNKIRLEQLPKMSKKEKEELIEMSKNASEKLEFLQEKAHAWLANNYSNESFKKYVFQALSNDLKTEILIQILGAKDLYSKNLTALIEFIEKSETGKQMTLKNRTFLIEYDRIRTNARIKKPLSRVKITPHGIKWGKYNIKSTSAEPLYVRKWVTGDKFQPSGMKGHKKLQDFFTDAKIPRLERHQIPVIVNEKNKIVSVANLRFDENKKELRSDLFFF